MKKYTNEQIIEGFKMFKDICDNSEGCSICKIHSMYYSCPFLECSPCYWDIDKIQRALEESERGGEQGG